MTDRAMPGAEGTHVRGIEYGEGYGQFSPGWVVPGDQPTKSAMRWGPLDHELLEGFQAQFSDASLEVTFLPGEAFVDGWLARDTETTIALDAQTTTTIALGWDPDAIFNSDQHEFREEADRVLIDEVAAFDEDVPHVEIWEFETDDTGVVDDDDLRTIGPTIRAGKLTVETVEDLPDPNEFRLGTEIFVLEENMSYEVRNDE